MRKPTLWFLNRSDTIQAVQAQKMARRNCTSCVVKTKALLSFTVTAKYWFSHDAAQLNKANVIKLCIMYDIIFSYATIVT